MFIGHKDRFEQKEIKEKKPIKSTWYYWLIDYIFEPLRKTVGGFRDNVVMTDTREIYSKQTAGREKKLSKFKIQKQSEEDNVIKNRGSLFEKKNMIIINQ